MKRTTFETELRKGYLVAGLFFILAAAAAGFTFFYTFVFFKKEIASISILQSQADFIRGDFRSGLSSMHTSLGNQFASIAFANQSGSISIQIPPEKNIRPLQAYEFSLPVRPEGYSASLGTVTFVTDLAYLAGSYSIFILLEITLIYCASYWIKKSLERKFQAKLTEEKNQLLNTLSHQLAHDIRSPLAVLEVAGEDAKDLPEASKNLILAAILQIQEISQRLLEANRGSSTFNPQNTPVEMKALLLDFVQFKNLELSQIRNVKVRLLYENLKPTFVSATHADLKVLFSNLINNAAEAGPKRGVIDVQIESINGSIKVAVRDDGNGISDENLKRLGAKGASFGKADGNGLGLFSAIRTCERFGGHLEVHSELGKGTTVNIFLPMTEPPSWHIEEVKLKKNSSVVVVEDDEQVRHSWRKIFQDLSLEEQSVKCEIFSNVSDASDWLKSANPSLIKNSKYFFDYDLGQNNISGLSLAKQFNLNESVVIVTNRYESDRLRAECADHGAFLIAKSTLGSIALKLEPESQIAPVEVPEKIDAILLDDNGNIRQAWALSAKRKGIFLQCFSTEEELFEALPGLPLEAKFYIDSHLGGSSRGEEVARRISQLGYREIYISTGYRASEFLTLPWLRGVIGKTPPWL